MQNNQIIEIEKEQEQIKLLQSQSSFNGMMERESLDIGKY